MRISFKIALVGAITVISLAFATSASASPAPANHTEESAAQVVASLQAANPIRIVDGPADVPVDGTSYTFGSGSVVTVVPQPTVMGKPSGSGVTPMFSVGVGWGAYIYLNRVDQGALATGGAAGLAFLICAIPAVNVFGCAAVLTVLGMAAYYIAVYGICSSRMEIKMPMGNIKCVR